MDSGQKNPYSGAVSFFHDRKMPEKATPVGYAALIEAYGLVVPLPRNLSAVGPSHKVYSEDGWSFYTPRHAPVPTLSGHLTFALKYEGLDLAVLKTLFRATGPKPIRDMVLDTPTGAYARRFWFLYEWLLSERLDLPDATRGAYARVVDPKQQWAVDGFTSPRHRLKNNLPGTPRFCPMVFKTPELEAFMARDLSGRVHELLEEVPKDLLIRTAAFLLLKDSRSSFQIEGESPSRDRVWRWGRVIGEAGRHPMDQIELERLQRIVIGDSRFVQLGLRTEGGFVGEHDRTTGTPIPVHVSARHQDLEELLEGFFGFDREMSPKLDCVLAAAILASGFVYIHPLEDGNGRLHRFSPHPSCSRGTGIHSAGAGFSCFRRHLRPHRRLP